VKLLKLSDEEEDLRLRVVKKLSPEFLISWLSVACFDSEIDFILSGSIWDDWEMNSIVSGLESKNRIICTGSVAPLGMILWGVVSSFSKAVMTGSLVWISRISSSVSTHRMVSALVVYRGRKLAPSTDFRAS